MPHTTVLPIHDVINDLLDSLTNHHDVILEAPPGAGKTTHVPLALLNQPWRTKRILMLEPRRMAAKAAAQRMATLLGETVGKTVGYRIRQETRVSDNTKIEVVTGGVLTRLLQEDPSLENYSAVIFDEFHERNLDSDLSLAFTLQGRSLLRDENDPLKIIVMSATLDGVGVSQILNNAPIIRSQGKMFPVEIHYLGERITSNYDHAVHNAIFIAIENALQKNAGSILVFLPGQKEIQKLLDDLTGKVPSNIQISPLYGNLSLEQQQQAIQPITPSPQTHYQRKIVLATDIAETSLTIEGVEVVIDSGLRREPVFDPRSGLTRLQTTRISQASATQRAGRAGRLAPGVCYRLWRQEDTLLPFSKAEIEQADLTPVALQLLSFGATDPTQLAWLTPPPAASYQQAIELLMLLGAVQHSMNGPTLTPHGQKMASFPAHPRLAHMMLHADTLGLTDYGCALAAALEETGRPAYLGTDIQSWVEALLENASSSPWHQRARKQMQTYRQLLTKNPKTASQIPTPCGLLIALAYPDRIAQQRHKDKPNYVLSNGRGAVLEEGDRLIKNTWIAIAEVGGFAGKGDDRIFAASVLDPSHFENHLQSMCKTVEMMDWDVQQQRFIAEKRQSIGQLIYKKETLTAIPPEKKQHAIAQFIRSTGLHVLAWEEHHLQWRARVNLLRKQLGNEWPDVSDPGLLNSLDIWLTPYLTNVQKLEDLRRLDLAIALNTLLPWPLPQKLEELAPTRIQVPSGSALAIDYSHTPPVLAVKLQEMFGCEKTPTVVQGRVPLLMHLLSPAQRPLQVTQDLAGFWRTSYHEVKKEMKGRYPKHPWPDNPLEAVATRYTKKRENKP